jgi:hypothetical protein
LEENLVVEVSNQTDLSDFANIDIKFAHSLMTLDKESDLTFYDNYSFYNNLGALFEVNGTSYFSNAIVGSLNFNLLGNSIGLRYRKIDPYFRTHGAGFLNNDIEDIMIINSLQFFQNKLSINSSFGRKQDDIKKENNTYTRNIAYGSDISWKEGSSIFLRFSYHNYTSSLNSRLIQPSILNDSLFQFQSRQNLKFSGMFNLSGFFNSISFTFLHQYGNMMNRGNFELLQFMPSFKKEITNSISSQVSYTYMKTSGNESGMLTKGPSLKIFGRLMDGKISPVLVVKLITRTTDRIKQKLLNTAFNVRYKINDGNSLYMNSNLILKPSSTDRLQFRTSLNYSYRF